MEETPEDPLASRQGLAEPWMVDVWVGTYLTIARGELDVLTDTVARLCGHPPTSLAEFLRAIGSTTSTSRRTNESAPRP